MQSEIDWSRILREQEQSGMNVSEFCRLRGINRKQLLYQRAKSKQPEPLSSSKDSTSSSFIRIGAEKVIEIVLQSGVVIKAPVSAMREILEVLSVTAGR